MRSRELKCDCKNSSICVIQRGVTTSDPSLPPRGYPDETRLLPSQREIRHRPHVIGTQVCVALGQGQLPVPELGGPVDEIGCLSHLGP